MSTAPAPVVDPQIQTTPTPAAAPPPVAPVVQPRDEQGRFATPTPPTPQTPPVPTTPAPPTGPVVQEDLGNGRIRLKYETGETFEGTPNELLSKVAEAHINTKRWAQQQRQQPPQVQPQQPASPFKTPEDEQAANYVSDLLAKSFGFETADQMRAKLGTTVNTSQDYQDSQLAVQFMAANPDYNPTNENSEKLVTAIYNNGFGDLYESGTQAQRLALMNMAHAYNIKVGTYQPMPQGAPQVSQNLPTPPPIPNTSATQQPIAGQIPPELVISINDSQQVMQDKLAKQRAMGLWGQQ